MLQTRLIQTGVKRIHQASTARHAIRSFFTQHIYHRNSERTGCFGLKGLHQPSDWDNIARSCITDCLQFADQIRSLKSGKPHAVLQTFDDLSDRLCSVLDVAELCRNVHPNPEFVQAADEAFLRVSNMVQHLNADKALYEPLQQIYPDSSTRAKSPSVDLSGEDLHLVKSLKHDFERGGIELEQSKKSLLINLQDEINYLSSAFISDAGRSPPRLDLPVHKLRSLPESIRRSLKRSVLPDHYQVPIDASMSLLLLKWIPDSKIREKVFRLSHNHQEEAKSHLLDELLSKRREVSKVLGYPSYAELLFGGRLASSPTDVMEFIHEMSNIVQGTACVERKALEIEKMRLEPHLIQDGKIGLHGWDRSFYIGRLKAQDFNLSSTEISQYLPLSVCLEGLADLVFSIFGVRMVKAEANRDEIWHHSVQQIHLVDESEKVLGKIFLDLTPRKGKYGHAAHFCISCGRQPSNHAEYQTPVVALVCNFGKDVRDGIRLLSMSEYETLFHEFGHSLHSILSRTKYQHLSGTRVATDLVEVPSHLFEHFAWDPRVLSRVAKHYKTGEPMPTRLLRSLSASRRGFIATDVQMQLLFSAMDLQFHGSGPPIGNITTAFEELQRDLTAYTPDKGVSIPSTFHHFVGYGAGYYSYIFAKVISAQLWACLFEKDPFSRTGGDRLRTGLLSRGGAQDPASLIFEVLGDHVSCTPFLQSIGIQSRDRNTELMLPTAPLSRQ